MIADATTATDEQARVWAQSMHDLRDQVAARRTVLTKDPPEWFSTLREQYAHHPRHDDVIDAVIVWRGVSDQTEFETPLGAEPPRDGYLRPYWDRLHTVMNAPRESGESASVTTLKLEDGATVDWETFTQFDDDFSALDDCVTPQLALGAHTYAPQHTSPTRSGPDRDL